MASPTGSAGPPQPSSKPSEGAVAATPVKKIGKYEIQKKIGAGGMGAVYLALDPTLRRSCALKVLPKEKAKNPTLVKRFKAEAQAAANLRHENIVSVFEADEADGYLYMALEYVEGTDVARLVDQRGAIPLKRSIEIVRQVAKALEHAHEKGIVHRDIKPGNLLVRRDGVVKLADMGLARNLDDNTDTSITRAGTTVGTVDYMAPEQARDSRAADVRSDIYSLGCTWYFMLTGRPPFPEGSLTNKLRAHAETPIPDPRGDHPAISEAVFGVIRRMTEKKAGRRYQTPAELLTDLDAVSLTSDVVSDTILSDLSDEIAGVSSKRGKRATEKTSDAADDGAPAFKPPPGKDKKKLDDAKKQAVRSNMALFYALAGLLVLGLVAGIISLVKNFAGSGDGPDADRTGNALANRNAVADSAGPAPEVVRSTGGAPPHSADSNQDPAKKTIISSGNPDGGATSGYTGGNPPAVDSGPTITRIFNEGGVIKTETIGRQGDGAGSSAGMGSMPSAARMKHEAAFFPDWAVQSRATDGLPRLVVQSGAAGDGQYESLNQALEQAPAEGAVIQLVGSGPFPLYPVKIANKSRIVIEPQDPADAGNAPFIVLLPPEQGTAANFLEFSNTTLDLRKVHLGLDVSSFSTDPDDALLSAIDSDLSLQNCSLSIKGASNSQLTAIKVAGKSAQADEKSGARSRMLIENTLIRGNNLTGLLVQTEHFDLAVRNSLIWSGGAPAVRFGPMARSSAEASRILRFASATLCSRHCAVQMAGDASQPVPTAFSLLNSLVAAPGGSTVPALFVLEGWNPSQQKAAFGKFLTWKTADSVYAGWKTLVQLNPGPIAAAATASQWLKEWKEKAAPDSEPFQASPWPALPIHDVATANLDVLAPQSMGKQVVKTSDGGWPGCQTAVLVTVNLEALEAVKLSASRPTIPRGLFEFAPRETIRVDVTKEDLGKFLERKKLQSGTQIIAFGSGRVLSSPIVIENAWVSLKFEPAPGQPLIMTPKVTEPKHDAFLSVVNGGIEIEGAVFASSTSSNQPLPKWFIQVVDGDLAMWRCRIHGPLGGGTKNKGLIRWQRSSGRPPERLFQGRFEGYAAFVDCYLIGSGTVLEADLHHRALFLRNSIAVSRNDLLSLSLRGQDSQIGGVVDLQYSTLSAVDRYIHVDGGEFGSPTNAPLAMHAERCVFAPPLRLERQRAAPTLLSYSGPVLEQKQVAWWENRCGYAGDITHFLRADSEPAGGASQNFEQIWVGQWGADQVLEPLVGVKGVLLKADLPTRPEDRTKLEPADFELHASSKAFAWDGANHPIGADVVSMKLPAVRSTNSSPPKSKTAKTPAPVPAAPQGF